MSDESDDRPKGMSFLAAAAWSIASTGLLQIAAVFVMRLGHKDSLDLVSGVGCQAVAYLAALFLMIRVHEPERTLGDVLGLRRTSLALYPLALGLGLSLLVPVSALAQAIEHRFPRSAAEVLEQAHALEAPTLGRKIALVCAIAVVGPIVEELFFRGGMFRSLRLSNPVPNVIVGVAGFFAIAHEDARYLFPILLVGLAITYARAISGSLGPGLVLHASFNGAQVAMAFTEGPPSTDPEPPMPIALLAAGLVLSAALVAAFRAIAERSPAAAAARACDRE